VCGAGAEWRANRKPQETIEELLTLRRKP